MTVEGNSRLRAAAKRNKGKSKEKNKRNKKKGKKSIANQMEGPTNEKVALLKIHLILLLYP